MSRVALLVTHTGRRMNTAHARTVAADLLASGFEVRVVAQEASEIDLPDVVPVDDPAAAEGVEIVFALGGDGTLLRAAELARPAKAPLLGINLGKVGFLAEAEIDDLDLVVRDVADRAYSVEERLTLDVTAEAAGQATVTWALNEISVEKASRAHMLEVRVDVDGRPLSRYGCDGVVCATPTGSTAYAFSAGGPVVWPEVEALLLVPISAHALFSRPVITAPTSTIDITLDPFAPREAVLCADGRRVFTLPPGSRVRVVRGHLPVRVVRLRPRPFTDRLVAKFGLPVTGWRGHRW